MTLTLYHAQGTRSFRTLWLCEELSLPLRLQPVTVNDPYTRSDAWRKLSPARKVPLLEDGDVRIFESGAIQQYVLDRYGEDRLRPPTASAARALHDQWCWFAEATLSRPLGLHRVLRGGDGLSQDALDKFAVAMDAVEEQLATGPYILGDEFCAADIMLGYSLAYAGRHLDGYPRSARYLANLQTRPAYIAAAAR